MKVHYYLDEKDLKDLLSKMYAVNVNDVRLYVTPVDDGRELSIHADIHSEKDITYDFKPR